jgi:hypothetical protein
MPRWCRGWEVLCWLGHRRFARHWSVPQLRLACKDTHQIRLSDDAIERYIGLYHTILAARQHDPKVRGLRAIERGVLEGRRDTAVSAPPPSPEPPKTADTPTAADTPRADTPEAAAPTPWASRARGFPQAEHALETTGWAAEGEPAVKDESGEVVRGYGAAVRGMVNDSQGGPLHPPGVRMRAAFQDVRDARDRHLRANKGGLPSRC